MRIFIAVLVLIFSLQSLTKSDDIRKFEIEGMSLGDSLLDFFSEEEIISSIDEFQSDKNYSVILISKNLKKYDAMEFHFKNNDKSYSIVGIAGGVFYKKNFNKCLKKQKEVVDIIAKNFNFQKPYYDEGNHPLDKSGKTKFFRYNFMVSPKSKFYDIGISCFNFSKELESKGYVDNFNIIINSEEYNTYLSKIGL